MFVEYLEGIIFGFIFPLLWKQIIHTFSQLFTTFYYIPNRNIRGCTNVYVCVLGGNIVNMGVCLCIYICMWMSVSEWVSFRVWEWISNSEYECKWENVSKYVNFMHM